MKTHLFVVSYKSDIKQSYIFHYNVLLALVSIIPIVEDVAAVDIVVDAVETAADVDVVVAATVGEAEILTSPVLFKLDTDVAEVAAVNDA